MVSQWNSFGGGRVPWGAFTLYSVSFSHVNTSSTLSFLISYLLCVHGYLWVNPVNFSLAQINGGVRSSGRPRAENKCSEAFVTVGGVLICSCQVAAQQDKCQILQSVVLALLFHAIIWLIIFSSPGKQRWTEYPWFKNKIRIFFFYWRNHFFTLQQCVFGLFHLPIALHDSHQLLLFCFCIVLFCFF